MKIHLTAFILALFFCITASAQSEQEDVIYLKNGTVYRGTIVEQVPNVSFKIEIAGGSVIFIKAEDVDKITKEDKKDTGDNIRYSRFGRPIRSRPVYEFHYRPRTWMIQAQALAEAPEIGFHLMGGYKFNQFGILAIGTGIDLVMCDLHGNTNYAGGYVPLYVNYSGEILRKHITPFYSVEAGYAFLPGSADANGLDMPNSYIIIGSHGGPMGGAGFGVRFYSRRRVHWDLSAHIDFKMATVHFETMTYNQNTYSPIYYFYSTSEVFIIPGLRVGMGF